MAMSKFKNPFSAFTVGRLFVFLVATIALVQVASFLLNLIVQDIEIFKGGQLLIVVSIFLTFVLFIKLIFKNEFKKVDLVYVILMGLVTFLLFQYGGTYFPQIFSILGNQAVVSANSLASTIGIP